MMLYEAAHKDSVCGVDFHLAAFLLKDISPPLAVAFDSTTLWFL